MCVLSLSGRTAGTRNEEEEEEEDAEDNDRKPDFVSCIYIPDSLIAHTHMIRWYAASCNLAICMPYTCMYETCTCNMRVCGLPGSVRAHSPFDFMYIYMYAFNVRLFVDNTLRVFRFPVHCGIELPSMSFVHCMYIHIGLAQPRSIQNNRPASSCPRPI